MERSRTRSSGRETRLLLATIAVSVATLLLLARFRFPEESAAPVADPAPAPLERLAARATFDELASIMADLERRVGNAVTVLEVRGDAPGTSYVPALRLADDRAVALVGMDEQIAWTDGQSAFIVARDPARNLVVVQVPPSDGSAVRVRAAAARQGPRYVAVVEATRQGAAVRPAYIGRTDVIQDPRGTGPLYTVGAAQQAFTRGAAMFSLDGTFIGLTAETAGSVTIVPADALQKFAVEAPAVGAAPAYVGIEVQALSSALARAAAVPTGVMVNYVDSSGPAAGAVQAGDVVQSIDGIPITTVAGFQVIAQTREQGRTVTLGIVRRGSPTTVQVTAADRSQRTPQSPGGLGAVLRSVAGAGAEVVTVVSDGVAARAGLLRGDIITSVDGRVAPDVSVIERAFRSTPSGAALLTAIQRGTQHRILALEKP